MKKDSFDQQLKKASKQLRSDSGIDDLGDFERGVWVEIALHDERWTARLLRFFRQGIPVLSTSAVAGSVVIAMIAGVLTALVQAKAYGDSVSDSMEAQYVESIHPVLRSESETHQHEPASR